MIRYAARLPICVLIAVLVVLGGAHSEIARACSPTIPPARGAATDTPVPTLTTAQQATKEASAVSVAVSESSIVFRGIAKSTRTEAAPTLGTGTAIGRREPLEIVTFNVSAVWKGAVAGEIEIVNPSPSYETYVTCAGVSIAGNKHFPFITGNEYFVFASMNADGLLYTNSYTLFAATASAAFVHNLSSGTAVPAAVAPQRLAITGQIITPTPAPTAPLNKEFPTGSGGATFMYFIVGGAIVAGLLVTLLVLMLPTWRKRR